MQKRIIVNLLPFQSYKLWLLKTLIKGIQNKKLVTMKRKILFGRHFFLIILLVAQEARVQIEAACDIILLRYKYAPCIDLIDGLFCRLECFRANRLLKDGCCINGKCTCYGKCT
ncbi:uncharacterized protein LOC123887193 isoform X3 [Trifolium pratense]|uniref:uncharacterized protein LOC123887193 isoform X3 n=1 Tax=Trifolium pratense TaxID=57577 RepID=UPI001E69701F|nr:uncharacterized protein LOC123887193 isoform X3 [Trifolium pratense]